MVFKWVEAVVTGVVIMLVVPAGAQVGETSQSLIADNVTTAVTMAAEASTGTAVLDSPASGTQVSETYSTGSVGIETTGTDTTAAAEATSVTLPEGVIYQVLRPGTGAVASTTQTMRLHYTLFLANGKKVESSREVELPKPLSLKLGQGDFIKGFELGVDEMRVGEIRRIFIPSELAYGESGHGGVPGNTDLIFEVELVDVK